MKAIGGIWVTLMLIGLYFLPWFVAAWRNHQNRSAICVLNLLLGWTMLGWIVALVWACTKVTRSGPDAGAIALFEPAEDTTHKRCPFCGEQILTVAIRCKHCHADLSQPATS